MKDAWERLLRKAGLRDNGGTSIPARRPGAGAVPGRRGACLAVRAPPAACFAAQKPDVSHHRDCSRFGAFYWSGRGGIGCPRPDRGQKSPSETTSPRQRVLRAWSVANGMRSLTKRTEPSAKAKLAPRGWPLPKAQARSSSVEKSPPGGTA